MIVIKMIFGGSQFELFRSITEFENPKNAEINTIDNQK